MPEPNVFQFEVFDCTALDAIVRTGFRTRRDGVETDFCGLRGVYRHDELAWDEDGAGFWRSGAAPLSIPTGLTLDNSMALPRAKATQRDTVLRVASGAGVVARWGFLYAGGALPCRVRAWNCATGEMVYNTASATASADIGELPDGSYTLAVAIEGAAPEHLSEAEYVSLVGLPLATDYWYQENDARYFYDFDRNLGVRPSNPHHPLNTARAELEATGAQQDKAEWIQHATSHSNFNSQWVMVKFVVGEESWEVADGVLAAPDAALLAASTGDETNVVTPANVAGFALAFDLFARSVGCYFKGSDGTEYIGGERSCAEGTETALWQWNGDGTATLLGTSKNYSTGLCECGGLQSAHEARRIVEDWRGDIIVQTLCSLLRYDPHGATVEAKLVPHPKATDGHPGGRSLLSQGKSLCYTTEYFGKKNDSEPAAQFYDTFVTRSGEVGAQGGIGTVAHVDGNLALWMNRIYGIVQNRMDATSEDAVQAVAFMSPAGWQKAGGLDYPASAMQLQRVARVGRHLIATGKERNSEKPVFRSSDGQLIQFGESTYRLRQIEAVMNSTGYETGLAPGFLPTDDDSSFTYPRRLIEIGERTTGRILDDEPVIEVDCTDAQCQWEEFSEGAVWFGEPLHAWGNSTMTGVTVIDAMRPGAPSEARPFSAYFKTMIAAGDAPVWARIDSSAEVDDLASYVYPVPVLSELWMLPVPARSKVEFVVVLPADAGKIEPLKLLGVC